MAMPFQEKTINILISTMKSLLFSDVNRKEMWTFVGISKME